MKVILNLTSMNPFVVFFIMFTTVCTCYSTEEHLYFSVTNKTQNTVYFDYKGQDAMAADLKPPSHLAITPGQKVKFQAFGKDTDEWIIGFDISDELSLISHIEIARNHGFGPSHVFFFRGAGAKTDWGIGWNASNVSIVSTNSRQGKEYLGATESNQLI